MPSQEPVIWIIATGSEILQGHYSDRNSPWLSGCLLENGVRTARHMALPDGAAALQAGLAEAARAADVVIVAGGLGPTEDDLTRKTVAAAWDRELKEDPDAIRGIEELLQGRGRELSASNRVQGKIPAGAKVLQNFNGTAPGFFIPAGDGRAALLALPGPPRELQPMFNMFGLDCVLGALGFAGRAMQTVTLRTAGLPESQMNDRLRDLFASDPRVDLAFLCALGTVDVRLTLKESDPAARAATLAEWREIVAGRLGADNIFGEEEATLPTVAVGLLRERGQSVSFAESCTGGWLASMLTDSPGASECFGEGFIPYANAAKIQRLGVSPALLERYGAVSAQCAEALAAGARRAAGSDWAVSVTGIAGPTGGSAEKPVGLVWFGLARPTGEVSLLRHQFLGDRNEVRRRAATAGLDLLRRGILGLPLTPRMPELDHAER